MQKKGLIVLIVISVLTIATTVVSIVAFKKAGGIDLERKFPKGNFEFSIKTPDGTKNTKSIKHILPSGKNYIAVIHIEGTITSETKFYNQKYLLKTINDLIDDSKNAGIMLYLNTPGGAVYETDELYFKLKEYKEKTSRPIYAYMGPMTCSAGYYLSCSAEKIIANRNTLTGAIGVILGQSIDATEFLDKLGLKSTTIYSGKNKNMMNFNEPFTDEQRKIMQSLADGAYDQFVDIVKEGRNMPVEKVRELADGRIYSAKQALENGLIDEISDYNSALTQFQRRIARDLSVMTGKDVPLPEVEIFRYEQKFSFDTIFGKTLFQKKSNSRPFELKAIVE